MAALILASFILLVSATPAACDPVTFVIAAALTTVGVEAAVVAFVAPLVTTGLLAGAALALAPKPRQAGQSFQQQTPNSYGARISTRQATPPQRVIYGRALVGGAYFFLDVVPPYLYSGILVASHEIDGVDAYFVNETEVLVDAAGNVLAPSTPNYPARLLFSVRRGLPTQMADPILAAAFTGLPASFRQAGVATIVVRAHYGDNDDEFKVLWGNRGDPQFLFRVRGKRIYDPRNPNHVVDDQLTWTWSRNAALVIADWVRSGCRLPEDRIDWVSFAQAARECDVAILNKLGTWEPRYTVDGMVTLDEDEWVTLRALLTSCRGKLVDTGGKVGLVVGSEREAIGTIHQGMLAGGFEFRRETPRTELVNLVRTQFIAPDRDFQTADGPVLSREDLIEADGATYEKTIRLPFTESVSAVQRIAKAYLEQSRRGRALTLPCHLEAIRFAAGDVVQVWFDDFLRVNGTYEVIRTGVAGDFSTVEVSLAEYDIAVEFFDPAVDESDFSLDPQTLAA